MRTTSFVRVFVVPPTLNLLMILFVGRRRRWSSCDVRGGMAPDTQGCHDRREVCMIRHIIRRIMVVSSGFLPSLASGCSRCSDCSSTLSWAVVH